jgi:hypothetical protein
MDGFRLGTECSPAGPSIAGEATLCEDWVYVKAAAGVFT